MHACSAQGAAASAAQTASRRWCGCRLHPPLLSLWPPALPTSSRPVPEGFTVRTEGKASILQRANDVFFNPAQVVNRDMSLSGESGQGVAALGHVQACGCCSMLRKPAEAMCSALLCVCWQGLAVEPEPNSRHSWHLALTLPTATTAVAAAAPAVLKYFIAQREKEIESGAAKKAFQKAANQGVGKAAGAKAPVAGEGVRVLEGLAASGLRAIR